MGLLGWSEGGAGVSPLVSVDGCAIAEEDSDVSAELEAFGIVMNFEPSLFVYFAVAGAEDEAED